MSRPRAALLALAWFATAVAAGFLFAWLLRREPERIVVVRDGPPPSATRTPDPAAAPAAPSPARSNRPIPVPEPAAAAPAAAPSAAYPTIEITVVPAEGMPLGGGTVYALEAGAAGPEDEEEVPHAEVGDDLTATLRLPCPGTYDIGFSSTLGMGMVTDVRVEAGPPQKLALRMAGMLRVKALRDPPWPPAAEGATLEVLLSADETAGPLRWYPGRHETGYASANITVGADGRGESPALPPGRLFTVQATCRVEGIDSATAIVECRPEKVRAGETVHLRVRERSALAVHLERPTGVPADAQVRVALRFAQGERVALEERVLGGEWAGKVLDVVFPAEPGRGTLSWSGDAIVAGAAEDLEFEAGKVREVPLPLATAPPGAVAPAAPELGAPPAEEPIPVEIRGRPEGSAWKAGFFGPALPETGTGGDFCTGLLDPGESALDPVWRKVRTAAAVLGPRLASDPVPFAAAGPTVFVLKPAGLLLAAPDEEIPLELGRLLLRLPDRRSIPTYDRDSAALAGADVAVEAVPGLLLGPLPEGTWTFEVRLGGIRLPDATATVKAGRIEVLRIRTRKE